MRKIVMLSVLILFSNVFAQFESNRFYFGLAGGIARGVNASDDKAVPSFRLYLQHRILGNWLFGQLGSGYAKLQARQTYWAKTVTIDERFLIVPYSNEYFLPYFGAGIGLTKAVYSTGTSYLGYSPIFAGIQTRLSDNIVLNTYGGFAFSFSDSLDGRARNDANLNPITNSKQDGYWFWELGLQFGFPGRKAKAKEQNADDLIFDQFEQSPEQPQDAGTEIEDPFIFETQPDTIPPAAPEFIIPGQQLQMQPAPTMQDNLYRTIGFSFGGVNLSKEAIAVLRVVADTLRSYPNIRLRIVGHADNQGTRAAIESTALSRAVAVRDWLVANGIGNERLEVSSAGASEPRGDNNTHEGRAINRRVEIWVVQ